MMADEAQSSPSSSLDANIPPPEPDPPPNIARMSSPSPLQNLSRSRAHSSGSSEDSHSSSSNSSSSPAWVRWSCDLSSLLDDKEGRDLFEKYLTEEGCSAQLQFLYACKGLKCTALDDPPKIAKLVHTIYRHFFQNTTLLGTSFSRRSDLAATVKEERFNELLFDKAVKEVQIHMQDNLYPNFLKSEIYLSAVNGEKESSNLQKQLDCQAKFVGVTKEALEKTEKTRDKIPIPAIASTSKFRTREPFTTSHFHQKPGCSSSSATFHPYHASYSSYNPASHVDSELQSMSSDAMTEDGLHSERGHSSARQHGAQNHRSRGQNMPSCHLQPHHHAHSSRDASRRNVEQDNVAINPNPDNLTVSHPAPCQPHTEFTRQLLFAKLEQVKRNREKDDEMVHQRLSEVAAAIKRIQIQDEGLQPDEILDQHMSRVFSDNTPNNRSPQHLRSPISGRRRGGSSMPRARRERDVVSTVSGDSGNVHDLYPTDMLPHSMSNSRSIPNDLRLFNNVDFVGVGASRHCVSRGGLLGQGNSRNVLGPLITRKTSSEFFDSGISTVSGTTLSTNQQAPVFPCDKACDRHYKKPAVPPHAPPMMGAGLADKVCKRLGKKTGIPPAILATQSVQVPPEPMSSSSANAILMRYHSHPTSDKLSASTKEHFVSSFVTYEDSQVPYVVKFPCQMFSGNPYITLAMFKEHLPKRGNYRYFFKRECAEVHANAVYEEITDDTQELPLYENKIVAHLQAAVVNRGTPLQWIKSEDNMEHYL